MCRARLRHRVTSLLVFVSPYEDARIPLDWISALDRHDMIFVSAFRSGNSTNVFDRREPLALLGAVNVMSRFAIDLRRIYVAGFSGGSRVAERLAIGYPRAVSTAACSSRGAIRQAKRACPYRPPIFLPASKNRAAWSMPRARRIPTILRKTESAGDRCGDMVRKFDVAGGPIAGLSHELPDGGTIDRLLDELDAPRPPDPAKPRRVPGAARCVVARRRAARRARSRSRR